MTHSIDFPIGLYCLPRRSVPHCREIAISTWTLSCGNAGRFMIVNRVGLVGCKIICLYPLLYYLVAVQRSHNCISRAMKDNRWNNAGMVAHRLVCNTPLSQRVWSTSAHDFRGLNKIGRHLILQTLMHAYCCKYIVVV